MPQLDTSTWFITILSMILTLFIMFQLKLSNYEYYNPPSPKTLVMKKQDTPWNQKWTKTYLPLSLPQH
uniref:ATP synthase complex subunit 8 n=1 Tax=Tupaia tana TaxID=70687 RepID=A0A7L7YWW0_TUPTA|nr:ATP synthase F0 subunit 8 [Tupaia tana]QOD41357.1 ATP synthase F0 subunit 8 [Tupaia tana]QOD41383.1 ATP synthase F0 subunit 8 [Tupaia tana]QOD41409.1 ATP synthase F0 subunit 8 [Tupaia tana]